MIYKNTPDSKRLPNFILAQLRAANKTIAEKGEAGEVFERYQDGGRVNQSDVDPDPEGNAIGTRKMLWVTNIPQKGETKKEELDRFFDAIIVAEGVDTCATNSLIPVVQEYVNKLVSGIFERVFNADDAKITMTLWYALPDNDRALCLAGLAKAGVDGYVKAKPEYLSVLAKGIPHLDLVKAARGE